MGLGGDDGQEHETALRGKIVVSMANALVRVGGEFQPLVPPRGSVAAHVQAAVPAAASSPPSTTCRPRSSATSASRSTPTCSSAATTTTPIAQVADIVAKIPGCRPLDAGELSNAMAIEAFTAVLLQLNIRYKTRVAPKLTGIKRDPRVRCPLNDAAVRCTCTTRPGVPSCRSSRPSTS